MSVYVDDAKNKYGRMTLCHMIADTEDELDEMADRIGIARRWKHGDHYDICLKKRGLAVKFGATEISMRQAVIIRRKLKQSPQQSGGGNNGTLVG